MALQRSESLFPDHVTPGSQPGRRVVCNGEATNGLVFSAYANPNAEVFPRILDLYLCPGAVVADVTYGKGAFWKRGGSGPIWHPSGGYCLRCMAQGCGCRTPGRKPCADGGRAVCDVQVN